jgi:hypothetical protein
MRRTPTDLRNHLYETLDYVATTGKPVEVTRGGVELCIVRKASEKKKKKATPRVLPKLIAGNPDHLIHLVWPWNEGKDL